MGAMREGEPLDINEEGTAHRIKASSHHAVVTVSRSAIGQLQRGNQHGGQETTDDKPTASRKTRADSDGDPECHIGRCAERLPRPNATAVTPSSSSSSNTHGQRMRELRKSVKHLTWQPSLDTPRGAYLHLPGRL